MGWEFLGLVVLLNAEHLLTLVTMWTHRLYWKQKKTIPWFVCTAIFKYFTIACLFVGTLLAKPNKLMQVGLHEFPDARWYMIMKCVVPPLHRSGNNFVGGGSGWKHVSNQNLMPDILVHGVAFDFNWLTWNVYYHHYTTMAITSLMEIVKLWPQTLNFDVGHQIWFWSWLSELRVSLDAT